MFEYYKIKLTNSEQQFLNFNKSRTVKRVLLLQKNKVNKVNNLSFMIQYLNFIYQTFDSLNF